MFKPTTAQKKIAKLRGRVRVVQGGTSASKTYSILPLLASYAAANPDIEISVVSETFPHLRRGAMRDFIKIMKATNKWNESYWSATNYVYKWSNGSQIEFFSADQPDKVLGARRDILFVNEANNIRWETFHQLMIRTRLFGYIDFNPSNKFWAHEELTGDENEWITLTYEDNEATPAEVIKDLERAKKKAQTSEYWRNWVNVYVYGRLGVLQGAVFEEHKDWQQCKDIPEEARCVGYGLDFGYTNDPTAIVSAWYLDGKYYLKEHCYERQLTNKQIAEEIKKAGLTRVRGYADSAEPKSIKEIKDHNTTINLMPVVKGSDSVRFGISVIHERSPFYVTEDSLNLITELRKYLWEKDKKSVDVNKKTNKPIDDWNHAIDAFRYLFMMLAHKPKQEVKVNKGSKPRIRQNTL